jgi:hypothetical protein
MASRKGRNWKKRASQQREGWIHSIASCEARRAVKENEREEEIRENADA